MSDDPDPLDEVTVHSADSTWTGKFRGRDTTDPERVYVQKTAATTVNIHASKVEECPEYEVNDD